MQFRGKTDRNDDYIYYDAPVHNLGLSAHAGANTRAGRDSGPDQDRYGAHSIVDRVPGDAGATAREQDPLGSAGILSADQERLRGLGAGSPCLAGGSWGRRGHGRPPQSG